MLQLSDDDKTKELLKKYRIQYKLKQKIQYLVKKNDFYGKK